MKRSIFAVVTSASLALCACGPQFDPQSELKTLRILAVQKDEPYAKPGDTVNLSMLWEDALPKAQRNIQVAWFAGCVNPPADLYFGCFAQLDQALQGAGGLPPPSGGGGAQDCTLIGGGGLPFQIGCGADASKFTTSVPGDIITSRPPPEDPKQPPFGTMFVFFAACAGQLVPITPTEDSPLPFACKDPSTQALLGPEDFVAGYSTIYAFNDFSNANPVLTNSAGVAQMQFRGQPFDADCVGDACIPLPALVDPCVADPNSLLCVPTCADDGDDQKCPKYDVQPLIDASLPANSEPDGVARAVYARAYDEAMWIDYYADRGNVSSPLKLFRDAQTGYNPTYGSHFYAPKDPGPLRVWAVVHDNRGGVAWESLTLGAK